MQGIFPNLSSAFGTADQPIREEAWKVRENDLPFLRKPLQGPPTQNAPSNKNNKFQKP